MPGYSGAGAGFKKPFTVDQIPGLKQAAEAMSGRVWTHPYDDGTQGQFIYKDDQLVPFSGKDIVYQDEYYYDQDSGSYKAQKVGYSTGQSIIDQAMADPLSWVASNANWAGLSQGGDFDALDAQMKFLKDNKYDLSTLPNQGAVNQYNVTKQILDQGTTGKWSGAGYGGPVENAKVMASMLTNIGVNDIKDFGKFNGVVSRYGQTVYLKDPSDPSKGYVYDEPSADGEGWTGRRLDLPKDIPISQQSGWDNEGNPITTAVASMPVYGETFGNKATKQSFVDTQNYNRAHGNIFSGTYIGHGHTGYGVQFAGDGTPYFYTQFGGDTSSMADIAPIISFLAAIPTPLQPFAAAANALIAIDNGNTLGALASLAGIPGVSEAAGAAGLANVVSAVKTANQVVNLVNAIETGNVMAIATSAAGMLGTGSMQIGDTGFTVSDAMKAVNLVKAIESENPIAIFSAAIGFGTAPNIQKALNNPTTTLDADGQRVADVVDTNFVADLVDPNSENFLGNAEESLGTTLAEAPKNIGTLESAFANFKDSGSKYFGGPSQDFFTSQAPASGGDLVGPTYTPESIGSVANLMSGPSADVAMAGGIRLEDVKRIDELRKKGLPDIELPKVNFVPVLEKPTSLSEVVISGTRRDPNEDGSIFGGKEEDRSNFEPVEETVLGLSAAEVGRGEKEAVDAALKAGDQEVQSGLEKEINLSKTGTGTGTGAGNGVSKEIENQQGILDTAKGKLSEAKKDADFQLDLVDLAKKAGDPVGQAEAEGKVDKAKVVIAEQKEIIDTTGKVIQDLKKEEVKDLLDGSATGTSTALKGGTTKAAERGTDPFADGRALASPDPIGIAPPDQKGVMKAPPEQTGVMKAPPDAQLGIAPPSAAVTVPTLAAPDAGGTTGPGQKGGTTTASGTGTEMKDPPAFVEIMAAVPPPGPVGIAPPDQKNVMKEAPPAPKGIIAPEQYGVMLAPPKQKEVTQAPPIPPMGLAAPGGGETMCPVGEFRNPITGSCEAIATPGTSTGTSTEPVIAPDAGTAPLGVTAPVQKDLTIDPPKEAVTVPTLTAPEGGETVCPTGEMRNPETGECEAPVEPEECKVGEVRDLTTGKCVAAPVVKVADPVVTTPPPQPPPKKQFPGGVMASPFFLPERPIVTSPSIFDDPVMRGALPDMPQETKFQGPLDQFLKLAMESSTPKPQQPQQQQAGNMNDRLTYPQGGSDYFSYGQQSDIDNNLYSQFGQAPTDQPMDGALQFNQGGLAVPLMAAGGTRYGQYAGGGLNVVEHSGKHRVDFRKGDAVTGPGDGQSDDIPAMLADGEYVIDAEIVAALGNGSTKAGSKLLDEFRRHIREHKRGGSLDTIPKKSKSPLEYLDMARRSTRKK